MLLFWPRDEVGSKNTFYYSKLCGFLIELTPIHTILFDTSRLSNMVPLSREVEESSSLLSIYQIKEQID